MTDTTTAIRIADAPIPPPSAARLHPTRPPLYRRQSRFTEEMAEDHTPAPSLYEHDETSRSHIHQPRESPMPSPTTTTAPPPPPSSSLSHIIRGMNGCAHGAACVILIAIMVEFLTQSRGHWYGKIRYPPPPLPPLQPPSTNPSSSAQAIALLSFLSLDTTLDVISLIRLHTPWSTWALLLRVVCGLSYLALFLAYVARDHVFPPGFTFWAMPPGVAGPLVYGFLWLLGYVTLPPDLPTPGMTSDMDSVWSLAHAALRRHRFGNGIRSYYHGLPGRDRPPLPPPHLTLFPAPPRHRRTPAWRKWTTSTTTTRRHDDEEGGIEGFTPRVGGMPGGSSLPLRERVERQQQRQRLEKKRQPSLHSTASTACDKGEGGAEEKGVVGGEEKEKEEGVVGVPGRVVVKM